MEIEFRMSEGDIAAFRAGVKRHSRHAAVFARRLLTGIFTGVLVVSALQFIFDFAELQSSPLRALAFSLLLTITAGAYLVARFAMRWPRKGQHTPDSKLCRITLAPLGLSVACEGRVLEYSWDQIHALEETDRHFLLFITPYQGHAIPKHAFVGAEQAYGFITTLHGYWSKAPETNGRAWLNQPDVNIWTRQRHLDLRANLNAALRLVLLQPVNADAFKAHTTQLMRLVMLVIAAGVGIQYLSALPDAQFNFFNLPNFSIDVLLFVLSGFAVARLMGNKRSTARFLVIVSAAGVVLAIPVAVAIALAQLLPSTLTEGLAWLVWMFYLAWIIVVAFRAILLLYRPALPGAIFATGVYALLNFFVLLILPDARLFYAPLDDATTAAVSVNVEDTFYAQPELVRAAVDALTPERPGVTDLFFIGFAGEAREQVFSIEVDYVRTLFDSRFDTAGRSLALVNNKDTVSNAPIASVNNLRLALQAVAARMDKANDALFLFLTSHGSPEHELSVEFWPLELNILPAGELKALLDESGIVNRIIIVSACFSGGFIDALKDEHSLIMTAAARDKTSFGCGVKSTFTYFGEAYFKEALQAETSFIKAFELAKESIKKREQRESIEASDPQIYIGSKIETVLERLPR